jgi:Carboxypeptidase regulatory-like domain/TonB dependent receptor-like, beta-barrel/TonB-dependent Receptor Plug Domain
MKLTFTVCVLVVGLYLLAPHPVLAQATGGSVRGIIQDESGSPLPGVSIVARHTATDTSRSTTSDESGFYKITELRVGPYEFTASLSGFSTQLRSGVTILVGQEAILNFTLKVAPVAETITVVLDVPIIEPTKTSIGTTITDRQIDDLPLPQRDFESLIKLSPGVTRSVTEATDISGAGSSGSSNTLLIDGVSNDQDSLGDFRGDFSPDAISQFQVQSAAYQAEYGQASGAVVNVLTRSGTNDFHGRASVFYRADSLSAGNPFVPEAPFDQTIGGGFLAGPIVKDNVFFFASYEHTFRNDTAVVSVDPALLAALGQRTDGSFEKPLREPRVLFKLDYRLSDNQTLIGRYRLDKSTLKNDVVGDTFSFETGVTTIETNQDFAVSHTWLVSETKLNEARFQFARQDNDITEVNCPDCPFIIRPSVNTGKLPNFPQTFVEDRYQFVDAFSFEVPDKGGDHFLKAGFDFSHITLNAFVPQFFDGVFLFSTDKPFNPNDRTTYPDLFIGGTGNPDLFIENNIYALYFQDQWILSPFFTLNLGLRWDYEDHLSIEQDKNNFGPRIHFAWDVLKDGKTSIRGGYGRYYDQIFLNAPLISSVFEPGRFTTQLILAPGYPDPSVGGLPLPPQPPDLSVLDLDGRTPSKDTFSIGFQRELTKDMGISVDAVIARGHDLLLLRDANAPINGARPDPTVGRKLSIQTDGRSEYEALLVGLQRRFIDRFSVTLAYTLAKNEDNTAGHRNFISNSYDIDADFGPSDNDIRHTLNAAALIEGPWGLKFGLGTTATSAPNFNIVTGDDTNLDGELNDRPPGVTRNSGEAEPLWTVDARVSKVFTFNKVQAEVLVEAFNLFNRANVGNFQNNLLSLDFGEPTGIVEGFEPRRVQLGLRVDF